MESNDGEERLIETSTNSLEGADVEAKDTDGAWRQTNQLVTKGISGSSPEEG